MLPTPPPILKIILSLLGDLCLFQQFFGKGKRSIMSSVQTFGEMNITTYKDNSHQAKFANQVTPGIWVGFTEGHPFGTYHVYNPKTKYSFHQGHDFPTEISQRLEYGRKTDLNSYKL